jgi:putative ABC transport system ATP-binding protein
MVNGQPVMRPVLLATGDTLQFGRLTMTFHGERTIGRGSAAALRERAGDAAPGHALGPATRGDLARSATALIRLERVVKTYEASAGPVTVLRGLSLTVQPGEFVAIVGPSGCGKSTLLNMITGIDRPDAGEVVVDGQDLCSLSGDALVRWRGRGVGIVFQFFQLLPTLTVAENVMLPMAFSGTYPGAQRSARVQEVLHQVGLAHLADRLPSALSGGEQQRVAIARALANDPPILVADEPTGNLDAYTGQQIFEQFAQLVATGTTVLLVTHDPVLADSVPRRIQMLDGGIVEDS